MAKIPALRERAAEVLEQLRGDRISTRSASSFHEFLKYVDGMDSDPTRRELLARVVPPAEAQADNSQDVDPPHGWRRRPGLWKLFCRCHRGGIDDLSSARDLSRGDPLEQLVSLVRGETQDLLRRIIRELWGEIETSLEAGVLEISLPCPGLSTIEESLIEGEPILVDATLASRFGCSNAEAVVAVLKRLLSVAIRQKIQTWARKAEHGAEYRHLDSLLGLRRLTPEQALIHGFNAAVAVTLNSLLVLFELAGTERVAAGSRPAQVWAESLVEAHSSFLIALSRFNLNSFAVLSRVLVGQQCPEILQVKAQTVPFDGLFNSDYFALRDSGDSECAGILDIDDTAFTPAQLQELRSAAMRRGCPAGAINPSLIRHLNVLFLRTVSPWWAQR